MINVTVRTYVFLKQPMKSYIRALASAGIQQGGLWLLETAAEDVLFLQGAGKKHNYNAHNRSADCTAPATSRMAHTQRIKSFDALDQKSVLFQRQMPGL